MIHLVDGFAEESREEIAKLFWQAFSQKLMRVLGPEPKAVAYLARVIQPEFSLCALDADGRVVGLAGFKTAQGGLVGGNFKDMTAVYGKLGALWRCAVLSSLDRDVLRGQLVIDGLFVDASRRDEGIGSKLLGAVQKKARDLHFREITLDVIDRNTRARALYERNGFRPVSTRRMGLMAPMFGFSAATTLTRPLVERARYPAQ